MLHPADPLAFFLYLLWQKLLKDLRTGETVGDVQRVLDGAVTTFMESWLASRADGDKAVSD